MTVCTASTQARAAGAAEGDALGVADGLGLGDADGEAVGEGEADADGAGEAVAEGEADGDADALGLGDACVIVMVVTPFSVVAETRAPDAPRRNTPEIAPVFAWMKSASSFSIMPT
ncbi:MAG TPA: hypothetical protein VFW12_03870 [Candidatus Limnocylindria bacterium]|nr:hypothetical protein [Candidatus Limnocylindria bacterium]